MEAKEGLIMLPKAENPERQSSKFFRLPINLTGLELKFGARNSRAKDNSEFVVVIGVSRILDRTPNFMYGNYSQHSVKMSPRLKISSYVIEVNFALFVIFTKQIFCKLMLTSRKIY